MAQIAAWKKQYPLVAGKPGALPKPQDVIIAVNEAVQEKQVIVTTGVGQHQVWVPRHFDFDAPHRMLNEVEFGEGASTSSTANQAEPPRFSRGSHPEQAKELA